MIKDNPFVKLLNVALSDIAVHNPDVFFKFMKDAVASMSLKQRLELAEFIHKTVKKDLEKQLT